MKTFIWDESFITGLETVDQQHLHLVELVNQFGELLAMQQLEPAMLEQTLQQLAEYAGYHFAEEEALMVEAGIDDRHLLPHCTEHKRFLTEVRLLWQGIGRQPRDSASVLLEFLTHWLAYHILGEDQVMARQLSLIRQGMAPEAACAKASAMQEGATGPLLIALNGLFRQVSQRNRELVELNQTLEDKVASRTRELHELNRHLESLAHTDPLTGIPNRRHAMAFLEKIWQTTSAGTRPLACALIDADGFKEINDRYGHDAGDTVLVDLAQQMRFNLRTDDLVARLGGDEFMILMPDTRLEDAVRVAEQLRQRVASRQVPAGSGYWRGSLSIGVSARTAQMTHYRELIKAADLAVYESKHNGRNRVSYRAD